MGEPKPDKQGAEKDNKGTAKGGKEDGQAKDKDKGQDKGGQAKDNGDKDQKNKGETKGPGGKEGGFGTAKRDDAKAKNNLAADLNQDEWGKLPAKMRQLMDVYSKERFMPRYDDLLRQYYRTIAEQSMKKDD
jgi:hypothetical protein